MLRLSTGRNIINRCSGSSLFLIRNISSGTVIRQLKKAPPMDSMAFPCLDKLDDRTAELTKNCSFNSGPEPSYSDSHDPPNYQVFTSNDPLILDYGSVLNSFNLAYETWGELNADKSNAILLHTGLSASSHAHSTELNKKPGWWENFIGPSSEFPIDSSKYFIICTNVLGGCFGSSGPSSINPQTGQRYATSFPILTIPDMIRAQNRLIKNHFKISKLYASVGASMGGMQSLAYATNFPNETSKVISISACARSHPYSIALRHTQRAVLLSDPHYSKTRGNYYNSIPPHTGLKLAREIATVTYRSGPEWESRFGRDRANPLRKPALCPDFLIETYLDHAGEKWCLEYDANSFLWISKAMDLFDMGIKQQTLTKKNRKNSIISQNDLENELENAFPINPIEETPREKIQQLEKNDIINGLLPMSNLKTLIIGVESDILFPQWQQKEISDTLKKGSILQGGDGSNIKFVNLNQDQSWYGHDTFLLDLKNVGGAIKEFL